MEPSAHLTYDLGLEHYHPAVSILGGHVGRLERELYIILRHTSMKYFVLLSRKLDNLTTQQKGETFSSRCISPSYMATILYTYIYIHS